MLRVMASWTRIEKYVNSVLCTKEEEETPGCTNLSYCNRSYVEFFVAGVARLWEVRTLRFVRVNVVRVTERGLA